MRAPNYKQSMSRARRKTLAAAFCAAVALACAPTWAQVTSGKRIVLLAQNQAPVTSVAFSPDGKRLVTGHHDESVTLWDLSSAEPNKQLLGKHRRPVTSVAFSPDGRIVASAGIDRNVMLWDTAKRARLGQPLRHPGIVHMLAFEPKRGVLGTVSAGKHVKVWDLAMLDAPTEAFAADLDAAYFIAFSADGSLAATASGDNNENVFVWSTGEWKRQGAALTHPGQVHALAFAPQGNTLASGGWSVVALWDAAAQGPLAQLQHAADESVQCLAFSPDGATLAVGLTNQRIVLWDVAKRQRRADLSGGHQDEVWSVAFRPDGAMLASAAKDGTIALWQLEVTR